MGIDVVKHEKDAININDAWFILFAHIPIFLSLYIIGYFNQTNQKLKRYIFVKETDHITKPENNIIYFSKSEC